LPYPRVQILVCVNERAEGAEKPSCGRRGSLDLYRRLKDRVRELGLRDEVIVTRTGCLKHCSLGPTVGVWPHNRWYGGVAAEHLDDLVRAAAADDATAVACVEPLAIPRDAPWE
jgi:(2Fe-2S) ferredoxin